MQEAPSLGYVGGSVDPWARWYRVHGVKQSKRFFFFFFFFFQKRLTSNMWSDSLTVVMDVVTRVGYGLVIGPAWATIIFYFFFFFLGM
jgi:hypothetical protein